MTTVAHPLPGPALKADRAESRFRTTAAALLSVWGFAYLLGITWDIQWHADVGPDTFWTKSHLFFYAGAALSGLIALWVLITSTRRFHRGSAAVTAANTTPFLGYFRAPVGFLISGLGALSFVLMGLFDLWWHTLFGFDITLLSPPHFGLLFSGVAICVGGIYAFASEANRARARGESGLWHPATLGTLLAIALVLTQFSLFLNITVEIVPFLGPVITYPVIVSLIFSIGLLAAASFLEQPGSATVVGLLFSLIRLLLHLMIGPLVRWEAALEGLPFRETAVGQVLPSYAAFLAPALIFVAGLVIDVLLWNARRYGARGRSVLWATGALAMVVNALIDRRWVVYFETTRSFFAPDRTVLNQVLARFDQALLPTLAVCAVVGALAGWLGWNFGLSLRTTKQ